MIIELPNGTRVNSNHIIKYGSTNQSESTAQIELTTGKEYIKFSSYSELDFFLINLDRAIGIKSMPTYITK